MKLIPCICEWSSEWACREVSAAFMYQSSAIWECEGDVYIDNLHRAISTSKCIALEHVAFAMLVVKVFPKGMINLF